MVGPFSRLYLRVPQLFQMSPVYGMEGLTKNSLLHGFSWSGPQAGKKIIAVKEMVPFVVSAD